MMGNFRFSLVGFNPPKGGLQYLILFALLFSVALFVESPTPPSAEASVIYTPDEDKDILPDPFEILHGTSYINPDTDGDGFIDGVEYVLRSDPFDPSQIPTFYPAMRVAAYKTDKMIKLSMIFFPGDSELLESFAFYIAYGNGDNILSSNASTLNLTSLIPLAISEVSFTVFKGFLISTYVVSLPEKLLKDLGPVSIGISAEVAGIDLAEIVNLNFIDDTTVQLMSGKDAGLGNLQGYYAILASNPSTGWSEDEVCLTEMEFKDSSDGITTYQIVEAQCDALLRQMCAPTQCKNLVGTEVYSIDPGFLIPKN